MKVTERPKAEIVARVLERIAEDRYKADDYDEGEVIIIPDFGSTFPEREQWFLPQLNKLRKMRDESDVQHSDVELNEVWSDFWTLRLLEQEPFYGNDNDLLFPNLKGKSYEDVITYLYVSLRKKLNEAEWILEAARETIPKAEMNDRSGSLDETFSDDMHERLSSFHARRLSKQFPKIIDRAVGLALLTADFEVPDKVKRYVEEASKSYLNGQWIACLMVCRSAIEFAVRDRLIFFGYEAELRTFEKSEIGDSLQRLIELAKKCLAWQYRTALEDAQKVRYAAVRAVHKEPPHDNECRDLYLLTRLVMHLLYCEPRDFLVEKGGPGK